MTRTVAWFSCGAASAVATKLALAEHSNVVIAYTEVVNEHPDNKRFLADCEKWFGQEVIVLRNERYNADIREVFKQERFLVSPDGAPCTRLLKRQMRVFFEEEDDLQVFGFTLEERHRAKRLAESNAYMNASFPLIEKNLTKADCLAMIARAGIEIPAMYRLGYRNNNCIGCVKGGAGYWNKIRVDFPTQFAERAADERMVGHSIIKRETGKDAGGKRTFEPVFLDELPPGMGKDVEEPEMECSFFCFQAEQDIAREAP
jgi:3'-phosphoadenosine 5'-phosphosulfate sulfotransferase (PAPS reductase)/FAD synthetase